MVMTPGLHVEEVEAVIGDDRQLAGVLRLPPGPGPHPVVVLVHGTLEQDRDGNMLEHPDGRDLPARSLFVELARYLVPAGIGTLSWDKRGHGDTGGVPGSYWDQAEDALAAVRWAYDRPLVDGDRLGMLGQSAGVYVASIVARTDRRVRAFALSGGLGGSFESMMRFNYERPVRFAARSEVDRRWVEEHDPWGLELGRRLPSILRAVAEGREQVRDESGRTMQTIDLRPWAPENAAEVLVRSITAPTLVIHGAEDLNVPVRDADRLVAALRDVGNADVERVIVPGADHSFQQAAPTRDARLRERMSMDSFRRPWVPQYFAHVVEFFGRTL